MGTTVRGDIIHRGEGLEIVYEWHDQDVMKISIGASSGAFAGSALPYLPTSGLAEFATNLNGFPANSSDVREMEFGGIGKESAGGYVRLRFSCRDRAAHSIVEIQVDSKNEFRPESPWNRSSQTAHFFAAIEPSAVDDFVKELRRLNEEKTGKAWLRFNRG